MVYTHVCCRSDLQCTNLIDIVSEHDLCHSTNCIMILSYQDLGNENPEVERPLTPIEVIFESLSQI